MSLNIPTKNVPATAPVLAKKLERNGMSECLRRHGHKIYPGWAEFVSVVAPLCLETTAVTVKDDPSEPVDANVEVNAVGRLRAVLVRSLKAREVELEELELVDWVVLGLKEEV